MLVAALVFLTLRGGVFRLPRSGKKPGVWVGTRFFPYETRPLVHWLGHCVYIAYQPRGGGEGFEALEHFWCVGA